MFGITKYFLFYLSAEGQDNTTFCLSFLFFLLFPRRNLLCVLAVGGLSKVPRKYVFWKLIEEGEYICIGNEDEINKPLHSIEDASCKHRKCISSMEKG